MRHRTTPQFWELYEKLPKHIQRLADKKFLLLKADPNHPSIKFKKIDEIRSARVGAHYRALAFVLCRSDLVDMDRFARRLRQDDAIE